MYTGEVICISCGDKFLYRSSHKVNFGNDGAFKLLCPYCRALERKREERELETKECEVRRHKSEAENNQFLERLNEWDVVPIEEIHFENENALYILGNGFDLMHCVPSSYYHFRDSMGKRNTLRYMLEGYITVEDIWADFEKALAHFDIAAMVNEHVVNMWLEDFGAYKNDSGVAEYYMALETAAAPIATVVKELPDRFRRWVNTLEIGTTDRPLCNMFVNGKVLCFNYTEFVEDLYGISKQNVCYIHGCRVKQKDKASDPLILGHIPRASDELFEIEQRTKSNLRGYKRPYVEMAQANVINYIFDCDEYLTKDTEKIIKNNELFFSELKPIQNVIVIGHSFSNTDWEYFFKIKSSIAEIKNVKWYFGCYGLRDLNNLENLLINLGINKSDVKVFRTDLVVTTPIPRPENKSSERQNTVKTLCESKDGKWSVEKIGNELHINNTANNSVDYRVTIPNRIKQIFFCVDDSCLLVVMSGVELSILLLRNIDDHWKFIGEFHCDHQHLLVPRLRHVYITASDIAFVYNNRVRKYSLTDCSIIFNKPMKRACEKDYDGKDIMHKFFSK